MAVPIFNPGGVPNLGNATSAQAEANGQVQTGLGGLSNSITGLGARLEQRNKDKIDRENAKGKEIFETLLLNAKDENEFNGIVQEFTQAAKDGYVLPGQAAAIQASRTQRLKDEESRQTGRGLMGTADKNIAEAEMKRGEADLAALKQDAMKMYAEDFARLADRSYTNDADALKGIADLTAKMAKSHPGLNPADVFTTMDTLISAGTTTRTLLTEERGALAEEADYNANAGVRAAERAAAIARLEDERLTISEDRNKKDQALYLDNLFADLGTISTDKDDLINRVRGYKGTLPPKDYADLLARAQTADLNILNPISEDERIARPSRNQLTPGEVGLRRLRNALGGDENGNPYAIPNDTDQMNPKEVADGIIGRVGIIMKQNPDLSIYKKAAEYKESGMFKNAVGDVGIQIAEKLPGYDISDGEQKIISKAAKEFSLDPEELMAIVGQSIRIDDGITGINNRPELKNDTFREKARAYSEGKDRIGETYSGYQSDLAEVDATTLRITNLRDKAIRAARNSPEEAARVEEQISTEVLRLRRIEERVDQALKKNADETKIETPSEYVQALKGPSAYQAQQLQSVYDTR